MALRAALWLALTLWPAVGLAQDWATRDLCFAPVGPLSEADLAPLSLAEMEAKAADIPNSRGRFWQITSPDGAISHLWGTYHSSLAEVLNLPEAVKAEIADARAVALEIDFTYETRDAIYAEYDIEGRYRVSEDPFAAQQLLDLSFLGAEVEAWVEDRLLSLGAYEDALYVLTYAGLAELLLGDPCEDFVQSVLPAQDGYIQTLGHIAGAEIIGLEGVTDFFTDLDDQPETAKAIVAVYASYLEPPADAANYNVPVSMYLEGRLGMLSVLDAANQHARYGDAGLKALERTDNYLLDFRNQRFLERALPELAKGDIFIAVGASHLPGDAGLVAMLRNQGFTVTRLPIPGEVE